MMAYLENIILFLGIAAVGVAGYYLFVVEGNRAASSMSEADQQSHELLRKFDEIREIELETDLFRDPRFTSLRDFGTPIAPVTVGRNDPFNPAE